MLLTQSIIVYTLLLFIMYWGANHAQTSTHPKLMRAIPIIAFTLVFGLRYGVGVDYYAYVDIYEYDFIGANKLDIADLRYEPGFNLVAYICAQMQFPTYIFLCCLSFSQIFIIDQTFKDEDNILKYIYLTLMMSGVAIVDFTNGIRQEIAFCFFLFSLKYIVQKKWFTYLLIVLLAISFHKSAIILLPLGIIFYYKRDGLFKHPIIQCSIVLLCFISIFTSTSITQILLEKLSPFVMLLGYDKYIGTTNDMVTSRAIGASAILGFITNIVIIVNSTKIKRYFDSPLFNVIYDLYIIGICCNYLFLGNLVFLRITQYFTTCSFICYAYALKYLIFHRKEIIVNRIYLWVIGFTLLSNYAGTLYKGVERTSSYVNVFQKDLYNLKDHERSLRERDKQ